MDRAWVHGPDDGRELAVRVESLVVVCGREDGARRRDQYVIGEGGRCTRTLHEARSLRTREDLSGVSFVSERTKDLERKICSDTNQDRSEIILRGPLRTRTCQGC